jgi:hypothetical protein
MSYEPEDQNAASKSASESKNIESLLCGMFSQNFNAKSWQISGPWKETRCISKQLDSAPDALAASAQTLRLCWHLPFKFIVFTPMHSVHFLRAPDSTMRHFTKKKKTVASLNTGSPPLKPGMVACIQARGG